MRAAESRDFREGKVAPCIKSEFTWCKVQSKNIKSESGAERLGLVSMHAGEVSGAVINLSGTLSSL